MFGLRKAGDGVLRLSSHEEGSGKAEPGESLAVGGEVEVIVDEDLAGDCDGTSECSHWIFTEDLACEIGVGS
jgi:hypothetical protein